MTTTDLDIHATPITGRHTTIGGHLITCGTYIIGIIAPAVTKTDAHSDSSS